MGTKLRSWWQNTSKALDAVIITLLIAVIGLLVVIVFGYQFHWSWAGLRGKTLWDWLQLLIIPAVLAVGGYLFNYTTSRSEQRNTQQRDQTERETASDNQREAALQAYIDKMSELLLDKKLRESEEDDEVRKIARVCTLTVLPRLDSLRKKSVLQFLYESGLIDNTKKIIDLRGADLRGANLHGVNLCGAYLNGTDLAGTDLTKAKLFETNLGQANLAEADLSFAILTSAKLSNADLGRAKLFEAELCFTDLSFTNLFEANLLEANLLGARLCFAKLNGANLSRANLSGVDLSFANMLGADLRGADLRGAKTVAVQIDKTKSLQGTIMPDS